VPDATGVSRALAGGQAPVLLQNAPAAVRGALDSALHAGAVAGVQLTFLVSGVVGVLAGLAVLVLVRPARPTATPGERVGGQVEVPATG
jgi:hypothetical protein